MRAIELTIDQISAGRDANLDEQAFLRLRRALVDGAFGVGDRLTIRQVAAALGTSPMPARMALRRLANEQALDLLPSGTAVVPHFTKAAFADLGAIRAELEPLAIRMAGSFLPEESLGTLEDLLAQQDDARRRADPETMLRADRAFLFTIYDACGAPMLLQFIESLWVRRGPLFWDARWVLLSRTDAPHRHGDILTALRRSDVDAAAEALKDEIRSATAFLLKHHRFHDDEPERAGLAAIKPLRAVA